MHELRSGASTKVPGKTDGPRARYIAARRGAPVAPRCRTVDVAVGECSSCRLIGELSGLATAHLDQAQAVNRWRFLHGMDRRVARVHGPRPRLCRPAPRASPSRPACCSRRRRDRSGQAPVPQVSQCAQLLPAGPRRADELFASTALAIVSLVFVSAVALGSMLVSAAILHLVSPDRRFDTFHALHEPLVIGVLSVSVCFGSFPIPLGDEARAERAEEAASLSSEGGRLMAPFDAQVLRLWQAGNSRPVGRGRRDRHRSLSSNRGVAVLAGGAFPPRLTASTGSAGAPCSTRGPPVLGSLGDVLIHRPSLVAGPVGSEWRNQRPVRVTINPRSTNNEYEAIHEQEGGGHRPRRGDHPR